MSFTYPFKVGDLLPDLVVQLWDPPASAGAAPLPADLTGATGGKLRVRSMQTGLMKVSDQAIAIVAGGKVKYVWQNAAEVNEGGLFEAEVTLDYPGNKQITFPPDGYFLLRGVPRLATVA